MPDQPPIARIDRDGDIWHPADDGRWSQADNGLIRTIEQIEFHYGPTREVVLVDRAEWDQAAREQDLAEERRRHHVTATALRRALDDLERLRPELGRLRRQLAETSDENATLHRKLTNVTAQRNRFIAAAPAADHAHRKLRAIRETRTHTCDHHCIEGGCDFDLGGFVDRVDEILATPAAAAPVPSARAQEAGPALAPSGCDDCSVEPGEAHRYPGCPGAVHARRRVANPAGLPVEIELALLRQANAEADLDVAEDELLDHHRTQTYQTLARAAYAAGWAVASGYEVTVGDLGDRVSIGDRITPAAVDNALRNGSYMTGANYAFNLLCDPHLGVDRDALEFRPDWIHREPEPTAAARTDDDPWRAPLAGNIEVRRQCPTCRHMVPRRDLDAPTATTHSDLDGAAHSVWLHGRWRWLTAKMSTEQREAWADAVERYSVFLHPEDGPVTVDRWWRELQRTIAPEAPAPPAESNADGTTGSGEGVGTSEAAEALSAGYTIRRAGTIRYIECERPIDRASDSTIRWCALKLGHHGECSTEPAAAVRTDAERHADPGRTR